MHSSHDSRPSPRIPASLKDLLDIARRHARPAAMVFAGVMLLAIAGLLISPSVYQSEARLFVRVGRESIGLDPTATTAQTISVSDSREFEMNSVMDLIESRAIFEHVVDAVGPEAVLTGRMPARTPTAAILPGPDGASAPESDRAAAIRRDQAVRALMQSIKTSAGKRSSVIALSAKSGSPELAQQILQSFLTAFQTLHVNSTRASNSYAFFEEQAEVLSQQLVSATRELSESKNRVGVVTVEGRQKTLEEQVAAIQTALVRNASALASSLATIESLRKTLKSLPDRVVSQRVHGFPDDAEGATRKQLADLRLKEQELLAKFTSLHPHVIAFRQQIDTAEAMLARREPGVQQETSAINPNHDQLQLRLLAEQATASALQAEERSLKEQHQRLRQELVALNDHDAEITRLQQRVDVLKTGLKGYTEKLEQARIDQALAHQSISNVSVVQPATFSPKPVAPKARLTLLLAVMVASLSALGTVVACEYPPSDLLTRKFLHSRAADAN